MPLLIMILIKEENAVHTSQKLKRSIEEDLHLATAQSETSARV
jgi:hypothetical protein